MPLGPAPAESIGLYCTLRPIAPSFPVRGQRPPRLQPVHRPADPPRLDPRDVRRVLLQGPAGLRRRHRRLALDQGRRRLALADGPEPGDRRPLGAEPLRRPSMSIASRSERQPNVGLVVSTLEPRKNAQFLFDWFLNSKARPGRRRTLVGRADRLADLASGTEGGSEGGPEDPVPRRGERRRALQALPDGRLVDLSVALRGVRLPGTRRPPPRHAGPGQRQQLDPRVRVAGPALLRPVRRLDG